MFAHYENRGKCEWFGGGLEAFAASYNRENETAYALTECLDLVRLAGTTPKAPEVLLTDRGSGRQMVIERKSVVWPQNYIHRHTLEHEFTELVGNGLPAPFSSRSYDLAVNSAEFALLDSKAAREIAAEISKTMGGLSPSRLPIRFSKPIEWSLRWIEPAEEPGSLSGFRVTFKEEAGFAGLDERDALSGTSSVIADQLLASAAKFERYHHCRRLVLLDFYGTRLCEDDIAILMKDVAVPKIVDEVWRTVRAWTTEDAYEIAYESLYPFV